MIKMKKICVFWILLTLTNVISAQNPEKSDDIGKNKFNDNFITGDISQREDDESINKKKLKNLNQKKQALILYRKGVEAFKDGNYNLANIFFNDFIRLYPHHPEIGEITWYQAQFFLKQQKYGLAAEKLEEYYRQNRGEDGEKALFEAINLHLRMGNSEKVRVLFDNLREINPDSRFLLIINQKMEIEKLLSEKKFQGTPELDKSNQIESEGPKNDESVIILD